MRKFLAIHLLLISCIGRCYAADVLVLPSYSTEELYDRAAALIQITSHDNLPKDAAALAKLEVKAAEFRGYVAGMMDEMEPDADLVACSKKHQIVAIAAKTAAVLSSLPIRRDREPRVAVSMSLQYACDELMRNAK